MVADELRRQADNFIELDDLKPQIARDGGKTTRDAICANRLRTANGGA